MKKSSDMISLLPWMLLAAAAVDKRTVTRIAAVGVAVAAFFYLHHRDRTTSKRRLDAQRTFLDALPQVNGDQRSRYPRLRNDPVLLRAFMQFAPLKRYDPYILAYAAVALDHTLRSRRGAERERARAGGTCESTEVASTSAVLDTLSEFAFAVPPDTLARFNFTGKLRALDVVLARRLAQPSGGGPVPAGPSDPYSFTGALATSLVASGH